MAIVPRVERNQVQEQAQSQVAISGARRRVAATAEDFGAGIARAGQDFANAGMQLSDELHRQDMQEALEVDQAAAKDAVHALMEHELEVMRGHTELTGREAHLNKGAALKNYQDRRKELMASLGSERARKLFDESSRTRGLFVQERIEKHASVSLKGWLSDQSKTSIAKYSDDAVQFGVEDGQINTEKIRGFTTLGVEEIKEMAAREGWPPIMLQQAVEELKSNIHNRVIARLAGLDEFGTVKKYYAANKDQISGQHRGKIEALLKDGLEKGEAIKVADDIWSSTVKAVDTDDAPRLRMSDGVKRDEPGPPSAADRLEAALAQADKIGDPEQAQKVRSNIIARYQVQNMIEEQRIEKAWKIAQDLVVGGGNPERLSLEVKRAIGPARFNSLRGLHEAGGRPITTREGHALLNDLIVGDPVKSAKIDLRRYVDKLSKSDMGTAIKHQAAIKEALRGGSGRYDPRNSQAMGYFKDVLAAAGITDKAQKGRFMALFVKALDEESDGGKIHPTMKRVQEIADSINTTVTEDGIVWGTNQEPMRSVTSIGDIHKDEQAAIREVIGAGATDAEVLEAWQIANMRGKVTWKTGEKDGE